MFAVLKERGFEVEQCDSSAIVFEEEITREMGEGWWARPSFAGGPSEFERRERERERESVANKRRNDDGEGRDDRETFFWIPKETIREPTCNCW